MADILFLCAFQEKIKLQVEAEAEAQLEEKERKLDILRDIVNNDETPRKAPRPAPKPRTYTTPGVSIQSARSEVDMSSIGAVRSKVTRNATTPGVPVNRIPAAKSMYNLNQVAATSASAKVSRNISFS